MHASLAITDTIYSRMNSHEINKTVSNIGNMATQIEYDKDDKLNKLMGMLENYLK